MKQGVDFKNLVDVIHLWSRVDRNIPVGLWEKIHACVRKIGVCGPLRIQLALPSVLVYRSMFISAKIYVLAEICVRSAIYPMERPFCFYGNPNINVGQTLIKKYIVWYM